MKSPVLALYPHPYLYHPHPHLYLYPYLYSYWAAHWQLGPEYRYHYQHHWWCEYQYWYYRIS